MILRALGASFLLLILLSDPPYAVPITGVTRLNNFRDTRGVNSVDVGAGDFDQFGADTVSPSVANTTILGTQGAFAVGPNPCGPLAVNPGFCATATPFSSNRLASWTLTSPA